MKIMKRKTSMSMRPTKKMVLLQSLMGSLLLLCLEAEGALTPIAQPFTGDLTETWEGFTAGFTALANGTAIMGGAATITSSISPGGGYGMRICQGSGTYAYYLSTYGIAQPSDGSNLMGINPRSTERGSESATITFVNPVVDFGAFWGQVGTAGITVSFSDGSSTVFTYSDPVGGNASLAWHGWTSDVPITSVTYRGSFPVIDGLQANLAPVPEPSTMIAGALLLLPFGSCMLRFVRKNRGVRAV